MFTPVDVYFQVIRHKHLFKLFCPLTSLFNLSGSGFIIMFEFICVNLPRKAVPPHVVLISPLAICTVVIRYLNWVMICPLVSDCHM